MHGIALRDNLTNGASDGLVVTGEKNGMGRKAGS
jgi:hypothetical protein